MGSHATTAPDAAVAQIAFKQHGVVTYEQLREAGLGVGAINLRVRNSACTGCTVASSPSATRGSRTRVAGWPLCSRSARERCSAT